MRPPSPSLQAETPTSVATEPPATPEPAPRPVTQRERIPTIDVVRGVALMGILLMNIASFSGPWEMYINPLMVGNHRTYNLVAWTLRWVLFEGKMRAAFSMLFGAGVILLTERAERRGAKNVADIFLRRNMWLVLFGVLHFYFIWMGDILYWYGLTALLFLYPCRKVRFRNLFIAGVLVLAVGVGADIYFAIDGSPYAQSGAGGAGPAGLRQETHPGAAGRTQENGMKPSNSRKKVHDDDLKAMRGSYLDALKWHAQWGPRIQATSYYKFGFPDVLGMMLIGMGLYRMGFLTGALSYKVYGWTIAVGFLLSIPINGFRGLGHSFATTSSPKLLVGALSAWPSHRRHRQRRPGRPGRQGWPLPGSHPPHRRRRTNRAQQLPLHQHQLHAFSSMASASASTASLSTTSSTSSSPASGLLNLILSPIWLRYFQFGPMEWVWRSLTYWKRQPMRRSALEEQETLAAIEPRSAPPSNTRNRGAPS